jgi:hypothetical protein
MPRPRAREPVPEIPRLLEEAVRAVENLRAVEAEADAAVSAAREQVRQAFAAARAAGISNALIGKTVGISRQRVSQISRSD